MGKIKSKLMRRSVHAFADEGVEFSKNFGENKKILKNTMPSKKMRNRIAGLMVRMKNQEKKPSKPQNF